MIGDSISQDCLQRKSDPPEVASPEYRVSSSISSWSHSKSFARLSRLSLIYLKSEPLLFLPPLFLEARERGREFFNSIMSSSLKFALDIGCSSLNYKERDLIPCIISGRSLNRFAFLYEVLP